MYLENLIAHNSITIHSKLFNTIAHNFSLFNNTHIIYKFSTLYLKPLYYNTLAPIDLLGILCPYHYHERSIDHHSGIPQPSPLGGLRAQKRPSHLHPVPTTRSCSTMETAMTVSASPSRYVRSGPSFSLSSSRSA